MARYHINDRGEAGVCKAGNGGCPFASDAEHFGSAEEARQAFEAKNSVFAKASLVAVISQPKAPQEHNGIYGTQANAIAHYATAHNSGETVYEHLKNADGSVSLKMSSWPRANEARRALEAKGYLAEFGANDIGQWLHISKLPEPSEIISSSELEWREEANHFRAERGNLLAVPKAIYSPRLQETIALAEPQEVVDPSGEKYLVCKPLFQNVDWVVRVY